VRVVEEVSLVRSGAFAESDEWKKIRKSIHSAVKDVEWPKGSGKFTINPESGKKRGKGNGVKPIKDGLLIDLEKRGWAIEGEAKLDPDSTSRFGNFDAVFDAKGGKVVIEWETGNISSSHRSLNKMALFLLQGKISAGILIVPSRDLYKYLTDRVGNVQELRPYFPMWQTLKIKSGILEIIVIEHDATSVDTPKIKKGTDGRALA
jgi:hypothetical protein